MSLIFERVLTPGIAQLSYLIGDDDAHTAAVIDPRRDVDVYLELARQHKLAITHVFETHIHADFVSGARELQDRAWSADIYVSVEGGAGYGFYFRPVHDGDQFEFGSLVLTARHTPGHTPEHISFIAAEKGQKQAPWGVFTGDSLFVNSAGRPDLLGGEHTDRLVEQLYDTLYGFYLNLDQAVTIHPAHGQGSPCGASIGDRLESTVGYERAHNSFLKYAGDREGFKQYALSTAPPEPRYYKRMKQLNAQGPEILGQLSIAPLPPRQFQAAIDSGKCVLIDTRSMLAFGGGHIPGAISIGARELLSVWAGWMLDPQKPILLVVDKDKQLDEVACLFARTGYSNFAGYLAGGMEAWNNAGLGFERTAQISVHELKDVGSDVQILDVRGPDEWRAGHIPGAQWIFLPELEQRWLELDRARPVAVYCNSGYRANLAASLLKRHGFEDVRNVPGSWEGWLSAHYPVAGATLREEPAHEMAAVSSGELSDPASELGD